MLSIHEWHNRYLQQARWTAALRQYLYKKAGLQQANAILEVGCGTGAILEDFNDLDGLAVHGLDIDFNNLGLAKQTAPGSALLQGDGHFLPYQTGVFDIVICHFLLLWVKDPVMVVREMTRVVRQKGSILFLAEPDYGGRIDYPLELVRMGELQAQALERQGAALQIGRELAKIMKDTGLVDVGTGVLGGEWQATGFTKDDWQKEWAVFQSDVDGFVSEADLQLMKKIDKQSWESGERVLYVPTFFGWGLKS